MRHNLIGPELARGLRAVRSFVTNSDVTISREQAQALPDQDRRGTPFFIQRLRDYAP
jgi:hypothetical protein